MSATLKLTHKAIGAEVRRRPYDLAVDGQRVGSVEMNNTIEIPVEPVASKVRVLLKFRPLREAEGEIVVFRRTGKKFLPIFLASLFVPRGRANSS